MECALAAHGDEDAASCPVWRRSGDGEVGAADHAELDAGVDDEGEADSVLFATEETLGAVNRVERPKPCGRRACKYGRLGLGSLVHFIKWI